MKRDRLVVVAAIFLVAGLAWAYTVYLAWDTGRMSMDAGVAMPQMQTWGPVDFALVYFMWAVMMVAMMVPTAVPMILMFATVNRRRLEQQGPYVPTGVFLLGYVVVWCGFAAAATVAQWGLHINSLMSSMMGETSSSILGGSLLLVAGAFQWSSLKYACLTRCRSPLGFIMTEWREGTSGALTMGLRHGVYCLGCCWILMALLFVLGVMNLLWIAALAGFVLLEKVIPAGHRVGRATGLLLVGWGVLMLTGILGYPTSSVVQAGAQPDLEPVGGFYGN